MDNYVFQTQRLGFRRWLMEDSEPFAKMNADADVMKFFPSSLTQEESDAMIGRISNFFDANGYGLWAVEEKLSAKFIGFIGITQATFDAFFTPCTEIGWRLAKEYWGKGYATEGAKRCLEYAFTDLGVPEVYSFTAKTNRPSERVMQKIGEFSHPKVSPESDLCLHVLYKIIKG